MIVHEVDQYSDAWYKVRLGIPTASQFHNVCTPLGVPTKGDRRKKYMFRLIAERLLQQSLDDRFSNYWTQRGRELEEDAKAAFARQVKIDPERIRGGGFITTDDGRIGASPDYIITPSRKASGRSALEIKAPAPWTQIEYLLDGPEANYKPQVQGHILVAELEVAHLWMWHPNMPPVHVVTPRDQNYIEKLAKELYFFCNELDIETERARRIGPYTLAKVLKLSAEMREDIPGTFPWLS